MDTFGQYLKSLRLSQGLTLRAFCRKAKLDPGNFSKIERGRMLPPRSRDQLEAWARLVGLEPNSDDWLKFFDLASVAQGQIPEDLLEKEDVAGKLPVLFRTLRSERLSDEKLAELLAAIRSA